MIENLDSQCASHAKEIADGVKEEDTIGKILGVLQEDGLYAFYLYSLSLEKKSKYKDKARRIIDESSKLLTKYSLISNNSVTVENVTDIIAPLASNIDHILFAKELLERTLIYARYHAKALGEESTGEEEQ
ncbi:MAG: hypothetical protein AB1638_09645 [Nitrospirota bacterium]